MFCTHVLSYLFFDSVLEYVIILFLAFLCGGLFYSLLCSSIICLRFLCCFAFFLIVPVYTAVKLVCLICSFVSIERPISSFLVWQRPLLRTPCKKLDPTSDRLKIVYPFKGLFLTMISEVVMTFSNIRYLKCFDI